MRDTDAPAKMRSMGLFSIDFSNSTAAILTPPQVSGKASRLRLPTGSGSARRTPYRPAISVLGAENWQHEQAREAVAHDARGVVGIARHLDVHGAFVDDDHEQDLRQIRDRGEALEHLDALEFLGRAQPFGHRVDGAAVERRADGDAREAADIVIARQNVSVDLY